MEAQEAARLYVPQYGLVEMRAKMELGPRQLAALWLIGFEDRPEDCGEITVMEIKGEDIGPGGTRLVHGIKPIHDKRLHAELWDDRLPLDPGSFHCYGADWSADGVAFYLDGRLLHRTTQSPSYPMQLMLNVYAFEGGVGTPRLIVDYVRGYRRL
jgi:beta-glucanase (GH16 family)